MICQYDIGRDDEHHPCLVEVKRMKVRRDITSETNTLIQFIRKYLMLDKYDNEHMFLITFDLYDRALGVFLLGIGDYCGVEIHKRNIAECLILTGARKFLLVHNHPDGALSLSEEDLIQELEMIELGKLFDIKFFANCVITEDGFTYSGLKRPIYFDEME